MATNKYFNYKITSEQRLYEDLIVEALQMYGQDVYYIPREVINRDSIFDEAYFSQFKYAYKMEMYIETVDGFDGEGDLFTKFGVEIRDAATFILARRRWNQEIQKQPNYDEVKYYRPREGDLIHLPLSNSTFEITSVEDEAPFYQISNLPVFKLRSELFEYNNEDFDTGVEIIDEIETFAAYQHVLTMDSASVHFVDDEIITQAFDSDSYNLTGEVVRWDAADLKLYVAHVGSDDGRYRSFVTTRQVVGATSGAVATPTLVEELQNIQDNSPGGSSGEVADFDVSAFEFIDFSESNPFGDPQ
jgi:hypothetical protein